MSNSMEPQSISSSSDSHFLRFLVWASSKLQTRRYRGPKPKWDLLADRVSSNDDTVRSLPIYVGGVSLLTVLFNRRLRYSSGCRCQQSVILQPAGDKGLAIIGGDTIRGFMTSEQAWIALIGEKLDATLATCVNKH